jgi:hypothetical protein
MSQQCLENKKIIPFARGKNLVKKELSIAKSDLSDAKAGYESERYKWSTIQAYYAMFHAARALIYSQGQRGNLAILQGTSDVVAFRNFVTIRGRKSNFYACCRCNI